MESFIFFLGVNQVLAFIHHMAIQTFVFPNRSANTGINDLFFDRSIFRLPPLSLPNWFSRYHSQSNVIIFLVLEGKNLVMLKVILLPSHHFKWKAGPVPGFT